MQGLCWRAVFLLNVPIVLAAGLFARPARPCHAGPSRPGLDPAGTAVGAVSLAAVTFAVISAGRTGAGVPTLTAGVVAVAALVGFLRVEATATDPLLPLPIVRRPPFATANAVAGVMNLGTLGLMFLLTLYLQTVQHRSALAAGVAVLPLFLPLSVVAPVSGRITARRGPVPMMVAGLLLAAGGVVQLVAWPAATSYPWLLPGLLAWGTGLGLLTPAVVAAAVAAVPGERAGLACGVNNTSRQAGGVIGIAAFGAIAGPSSTPGRFLTGLHAASLLAGGLFVLAALATLAWIRRDVASADGGRKAAD